MVSNTHWSLANFRKQVKQRAGVIQAKRKNRKDGKTGKIKRSSGLDMAAQFWSGAATANTTGRNQSAVPAPAPRSVTIQPRPEDIPSFSEFLEYILSTDLLGSGFSSHWVPYWRGCTPCHFPYSVIAKLETGEDDLAFIWRQAGLASQVSREYFYSFQSNDFYY